MVDMVQGLDVLASIVPLGTYPVLVALVLVAGCGLFRHAAAREEERKWRECRAHDRAGRLANSKATPQLSTKSDAAI